MNFKATVFIAIGPADAKVPLAKLPDLLENKLCDSLKLVEGVTLVNVIELVYSEG